MSNWEWVVEILYTEFGDSRITTVCTWQMMVLIPIRNRELRGIGIVEVLWKVLAVVIN